MKTLLNLIVNFVLRVVLFIAMIGMTFGFFIMFPLCLLIFFFVGVSGIQKIYAGYFDFYGFVCEELIDIEDGRIKNWFLERYNKLFSRRLKG